MYNRIIFKVIMLILFSSNIYSQNESIKVEIFLSKDTIRMFEPIEYCIKISNTSKDTIRTSSYKWQNYSKPALEIKSKNNPNWMKLWHSDIEFKSECLVLINRNCGITRKEQIINFPPNSSYYIKSVHYPIWKDKSQNIFQKSGSYQIRLSPKIKPYENLAISTIGKNIYLVNENSDKEFLRGLQEKKLNTYDLFVSLNGCVIDSTNNKKFLELKDEHENSEIVNWIEFQNLNKKIHSYKYKFELDQEFKVLIAKQKYLITKMIDNGFFPIELLVDHYIGNIEYGLGKVYDLDAYSKEIDRFNEKIKLYTFSATCK